MRNTSQHRNWISRMHPWASAALALVVVLGLGIAPTRSAQAQTYTVLDTFDELDGAYPYGGLVQATDGNFYGTTSEGGVSCVNEGYFLGCGSVFRVTPTGTLKTLYLFCSQTNCADGYVPYAGLVQASNGSFYGTTFGGGSSTACAAGCGTVFKITTTGTLTTLHSFALTDGAHPSAAMIQGFDGNLYGTTTLGGTLGYGSVFRISPSGVFTMLYSFCSLSACADGIMGYYEGIVQAANGNFYGTTSGGGLNGLGTVFSMTPSGALATLYSFCPLSDCADGKNPGQLMQAANGNLYGVTQSGGANVSYGTVFSITPGGALTTLYSFCSQSGCTDGTTPYGGLVQGTDGNLYGTTLYGGTGTCNGGCGTVYKITSSGTLTTLHSLGYTSGDSNPYAPLMQGTNGSFYGTSTGQALGNGAVFTLSMGLGPFVKTQPASGKVGAAVKILGTKLTGATSVTFNGTVATFTVVSSSEITTTVPTGATTGKVQVVTPAGTLSSNLNFRVRP